MATLFDQDQEYAPIQTVRFSRSASQKPSQRSRTVSPESYRRACSAPSKPIRPSYSPQKRRSRRKHHSALRLYFPFLALAASLALWTAAGRSPSSAQAPHEPPPVSSGPIVLQPPVNQTSNNTGSITVPDWVVQDLLPVNEYSRPGDALPQVNGVVVHYVGNPGTTAEQNRSYFANLAQTGENWASSHFVIGIDGKVIQCVPLNEIAYCSTIRNADTISIECCHQDAEGAFSQETMDSLVKLLNWLAETYHLERKDIIRHYDIAGKECPIYYVRHPEAWEDLLDQLTFPHA